MGLKRVLINSTLRLNYFDYAKAELVKSIPKVRAYFLALSLEIAVSIPGKVSSA